MRIMQVVGSTDAKEVNLSSFVLSTQLLKVPVKAFVFGEKVTGWEVAIENTHRVMFVQSGYNLTASILDGLQMSWCYIPGCTGEREVFQEISTYLSVPVDFHSVDIAVWYLCILPLPVHSVVNLVAHHTHSSNQFDEQEPQPSVHSLAHLC